MKPSINNWGYNCYTLNKKSILSHRLTYELFGTNWNPEMMIDHINQDKTDNRIENLRMATQQQNNCNANHKNKSGFRGVYKYGNKFQAKISNNKKMINLGTFDTAEKAYEVFKAKAKELHGDYMSSNLSI